MLKRGNERLEECERDEGKACEHAEDQQRRL